MKQTFAANLLLLLLRSRRQWLSASAVFLAVSLLGTTYVAINSLALDGRQVAERNLGSFDYAIQAPIGMRPSQPRVDRVLSVLSETSAARGAAVVANSGIVIDRLAAQHSTGLIRVPSYLEGTEKTLRSSYRVLSGRWPRTANEIVLSEELWKRLDQVDRLAVYSGAVDLHVTGIVSPKFEEDGWQVVAAPGTWDAFPHDRIRANFPSAQAQLRILWNGSIDEAALNRTAEALAGPSNAPEVLATVQSRDALTATAERSLTDREPLIFRYPSWALTALAGLLVSMVNRRRLRGITLRLAAVGHSPALVRATCVAALSLAVVVAAIAGTFVAWALGAVGRALVLPALANQPLSSPPSVVAVGIQAGAVALAAAASTSTLLLRPRSLFSAGRWRWLVTPTRWLRRGTAGFLVTSGAIGASGFPSLEEMSVASFRVALGILCFAPDIAAVGIRLIPTRSSVTLAARRLSEGDRLRSTAAASVIAFCIGIPTAATILHATTERTERADNIAVVPPGQIWVDAANAAGLTSKIAETVSSVRGISDPVELGRLVGPRFGSGSGDGAFGVYVAESSADIRAILPEATPAMIRTLDEGGVLDWSGAPGHQHFIAQRSNGSYERVTDDLPTAHVEVHPSYAYTATGLILAATAEQLGLPFDERQLVVFPNTSKTMTRAAVAAVTSQGMNARLVAYNVVPEHIKPAPEWFLGLAAVAVLGFVLVWSALRGQAQHLRGYAERLMATGLSLRWSRGVLLTQSLVTLSIGLTVGMVAGVVPVVLLVLNTPIGLLLDVPAEFVALLVGSSVAAACAAVAISLASLRPRSSALEV